MEERVSTSLFEEFIENNRDLMFLFSVLIGLIGVMATFSSSVGQDSDYLYAGAILILLLAFIIWIRIMINAMSIVEKKGEIKSISGLIFESEIIIFPILLFGPLVFLAYELYAKTPENFFWAGFVLLFWVTILGGVGCFDLAKRFIVTPLRSIFAILVSVIAIYPLFISVAQLGGQPTTVILIELIVIPIMVIFVAFSNLYSQIMKKEVQEEVQV